MLGNNAKKSIGVKKINRPQQPKKEQGFTRMKIKWAHT